MSDESAFDTVTRWRAANARRKVPDKWAAPEQIVVAWSERMIGERE